MNLYKSIKCFFIKNELKDITTKLRNIVDLGCEYLATNSNIGKTALNILITDIENNPFAYIAIAGIIKNAIDRTTYIIESKKEQFTILTNEIKHLTTRDVEKSNNLSYKLVDVLESFKY